MNPSPRYSLVVPFFNEAGNILPLIASAAEVLAMMRGDWEAILVNDGSTDATDDEMRAKADAVVDAVIEALTKG